jgi:hypothetical protein
MRLALTFVVAIVLVVGLVSAKEKDRGAWNDFTPSMPVVAVSTEADDATKAAARDVADALGVKLSIETNRNPTCCVWVEVSGWKPNPGTDGWVIINQPGGSIVSAADADQLQSAVTRFKQSIRMKAGEAMVPIGLMTSYPLISHD